MRLQWLNFLVYVFVLLFLFSIISDWRSLKIENENSNTKTMTTEIPYMAEGILNSGLYRN